MKLFGRKKEPVQKTEYEELRDLHAEYREACKDLEKQFQTWDKRVGVMNKDAEKSTAALYKACGIAGVSGVLTVEEITAIHAKLQAEIDSGKQMIREIIQENSETRKMIDEREKAEKVMHSKESAAEKAEKKNDEKAPQYRDEATKAAEDFRNSDHAVMERLRSWTQRKGEVFSRCYQVMAAVLKAPQSLTGGGGGGGGQVVIQQPQMRQTGGASGGGGGGAASIPSADLGSSVKVPADLSRSSKAELDSLHSQVTTQIGRYNRQRDELHKLAAMYKKDPDAAGKAQAEAEKIQKEINVLEKEKARIETALKSVSVAPAAGAAPVDSGGKKVTARALYDFVAERPEELSLQAGDVVIVIDDSDTDGWWEGSLNGVSGFFPGTYVQKM